MIKSRIFLYTMYLLLPIAASIHYSLHPAPDFPKLLFPLVAGGAIVLLSAGFRKPAFRFLTAFLICFIIAGFEFLELLSYYLQGESFNGRYFFHVRPDTLLVGAKAYKLQAASPFVAALIVLAVDLFLCRRGPGKKVMAIPLIALLALSLLFLPNSPKKFMAVYNQFQDPGGLNTEEEFAAELKKYNVNVAGLQPGNYYANQTPQSKNLVFIYLESVERAYLDETIFPELTPNIKRTLQSALEFTNVEQDAYAGWTIAGIFSSQCSMPLMVNGNDSMYQSQYVKNVTCMGDVLHKAGYRQVYMGGASLSFAGKGEYFRNHGWDEVLGHLELKDKVKKTAYQQSWGLFDDTLFEMAAEKYHELAKQGGRFALTFLSIDTHHPNGNASRSCPAYPLSENSMLQAVHCTDFLLDKFIQSIQGSDAFDDTLVFVMSDHLAMRNVASDMFPKWRKNLAFALNAGQTGKIDMRARHYDISHTILDLLGVDANVAFPLGQSLMEEEKKDRFKLFETGNDLILRKMLAHYDRKNYMRTSLGNGVSIKSESDKTITIGGSEIIMSHHGYPKLPVDLIFLVQGSLSGQMEKFDMVDEASAIQWIEKSPESLFFMLTQKASLPYVASGTGEEEGWRWYLGSPSSLGGETGVFADLGNFEIGKELCRKIIEASADVSEEIFQSKKSVR